MLWWVGTNTAGGVHKAQSGPHVLHWSGVMLQAGVEQLAIALWLLGAWPLQSQGELELMGPSAQKPQGDCQLLVCAAWRHSHQAVWATPPSRP
jgi:hypothetical protein